ncbi:hypothetical protein EW146_g3781 [Bondarzewia mesenterica]|uniref:YTH domain-containing protein n=1 Tax=Bondarzewia mesenterica TaxID=1095465 RepID=A0A4S4LYD4_9AGAM|nr:hypothetical protein EW146_g3781 [Bondarzewia mesenterica]
MASLVKPSSFLESHLPAGSPDMTAGTLGRPSMYDPYPILQNYPPTEPVFYDLQSRLPSSSKHISSFHPERSRNVVAPRTEYKGDASPSPRVLNNMADSPVQPTDADRPARPSRHRSHSQTNTPARRQQPPRPPFHASTPHMYQHGSSSNVHESNASTSSTTSFPAPSSIYQPSPPFGQRGGFVGPQYTMSHQQPPPMVHSPHQFAFPHHPGMPGPDTSMPHLTYSSASMMPVMQTPMFPFNSEPSSSQHPFTTGTGQTLSVFTHPQVNPSSPPHSPLSPVQGSSSQAGRHTVSYTGQPTFSPMRYSTPPQYAYAPPPSFPPNPSMFQSQFGPSHYPQSYGLPSDQEGQGTWWYLPPGATTSSGSYEGPQSHFQTMYGMSYPSVARREGEGYNNSGPSNPPSGGPPSSQQQVSSRFGDLYAGVATFKDPPLSQSPSRSPSSTHPPSTVPPTASSEHASAATEPEPRHVPRRPYHPNPPTQRSEWVMWAGNVPSDATHDELWRFFNQPASSNLSETSLSGTVSDDVSGGVSSIFLISRSNCAFVNFATEQHLEAATARFNGQTIRPNDPRCPRFVCRIRRRIDDLRAGVGGQRGIGMHTKWIKERKEQTRQEQRSSDLDDPTSPELLNFPPSVSSPEDFSGRLQDLSLLDDEGVQSLRKKTSHSNSSGSFASTNSSLLTRYFPERYFILKSLTQFDLDLSVEKGLWATQRHNEGILDQAYRTSKDVYLIFGVNKSGEFYGYARMAGPISRGEQRVPWATPSAPSSSPPAQSPSGNPQPSLSYSRSPQAEIHNIIPADEHRFSDESPLPVSGAQERSGLIHSPSTAALPQQALAGQVVSAPADLREAQRRLGSRLPLPRFSLDARRGVAPQDEFELDASAPIRALKHTPDASPDITSSPSSSRKEQSEPLLQTVTEDEERRDPVDPPKEEDYGEVWGEPFKVEWIQTERLPFYRTRNLRNPWNHGREVKVSRDGTELEPGVGKDLLEEWARPPPSSPTMPAIMPTRSGPQRRTPRPPPHNRPP